MCVIPLAAVTQSFKPKGNKEQEKKRAPRFCLSYILWAQVSPYASLRSPPSIPKETEDIRQSKKGKKKTKQNHGWIENASCIKELFVDLLKILVCSTTQKHSSNNKPNRSVNSTLLTSPYPVCMHTCQILTRCQKKTSSNPLTSSLSVTYLFPFFPTTTQTRKKKRISELPKQREKRKCVQA